MIKVMKRYNEDRYDLHSKKYRIGIIYYDGEDWVFDPNPELIFRAKDIKRINKIMGILGQPKSTFEEA